MKDIFWAILKIFVFLLVLPLIATSVIAFQSQILALPVPKEAWILWGAGTYVGLNIFLYDFKDAYVLGKALVEKVFTFFKPAGYVIPVYSIALILIYVVALILGHGPALQAYFYFAIAFTLAMQLIQSAREIYDADNSVLKAHYLCTFGLILIASLFLMSLLLAWVVPEYSFVGFVKSLSSQTFHLYKSIYKGIFIDSSI